MPQRERVLHLPHSFVVFMVAVIAFIMNLMIPTTYGTHNKNTYPYEYRCISQIECWPMRIAPVKIVKELVTDGYALMMMISTIN